MEPFEQNLVKLPHRQVVQVAIYAAELVIDLISAEHKPLADKCIEVAKKWLKGEATAEECEKLADKMWFDIKVGDIPPAMSIRPVAYAAWSAWGDKHLTDDYGYYARMGVRSAIGASSNPEETAAKINTYFDNLLNIDKYVEEAFLGGD